MGPPLWHFGEVRKLAFSPDGATLLTASMDGTARLWRTATGQPLGQPFFHQGAVWAVAFSRDGSVVLTGSRDTTARFWDAATGKPIGPPLVHQRMVHAAVFSPDGKTVLTASDDGKARLWQTPVPLKGGPETLTCRAQLTTGIELEKSDMFRELDARGWHRCQQHLKELEESNQGTVTAVAE